MSVRVTPASLNSEAGVRSALAAAERLVQHVDLSGDLRVRQIPDRSVGDDVEEDGHVHLEAPSGLTLHRGRKILVHLAQIGLSRIAGAAPRNADAPVPVVADDGQANVDFSNAADFVASAVGATAAA